MILGDDERRADGTDHQPEQQECLKILRQTNSHDGKCTQCQQTSIGQAWTDPVAQPADQQPRKYGDRHGADDGPADLVLGELLRELDGSFRNCLRRAVRRPPSILHQFPRKCLQAKRVNVKSKGFVPIGLGCLY